MEISPLRTAFLPDEEGYLTFAYRGNYMVGLFL